MILGGRNPSFAESRLESVVQRQVAMLAGTDIDESPERARMAFEIDRRKQPTGVSFACRSLAVHTHHTWAAAGTLTSSPTASITDFSTGFIATSLAVGPSSHPIRAKRANPGEVGRSATGEIRRRGAIAPITLDE